MSGALTPLELELAAYSPLELAELDDTVRILLDAANDGTVAYADAQCTIYEALKSAISRRLVAEAAVSRTATIIPFRGRA